MGNLDVEKGNPYDVRRDSSLLSPIYSAGEPSYEEAAILRQTYGRRMIYSFQRDPSLTLTPKGVIGSNGRVFNPETAAFATAASPLARKLKGRHLQMIAIGGSIGETYTGFSAMAGC